MASDQRSRDLSLDDQRLLLAIRSSKEVTEQGHQRADFSQLRKWLDWSRDRMDARFDSLEGRGLISISYRSPEEMETNRTPPRIATLTEVALNLIGEGALKDAMFEKVSETADPQTYEDIFERLDAVETLVEVYRSDSITYYEKWSDVLTKLRMRVEHHNEDIEDIEGRIGGLASQISTVYATLYDDDGVSRDYAGLNHTVNELIAETHSLQQAIARHESQVVELDQYLRDKERAHQNVRERLERIEEYLRANGHRVRSERFGIDEGRSEP